MNQCTALALLPPPDRLIALAPPGHRPESAHVLCELGTDHDDHHAALLWDEGGHPGSAVWIRWQGPGPARLTPLPWCPARNPHNEADEACELFAAHPSAHSWDITDPTHTAITHHLTHQHPHLFPQFRDGSGGGQGLSGGSCDRRQVSRLTSSWRGAVRRTTKGLGCGRICRGMVGARALPGHHDRRNDPAPASASGVDPLSRSAKALVTVLRNDLYARYALIG